MPTSSQHPDLLDYKVQNIYRGQEIKICLSSIALDFNNSIVEIFSNELLEENGYSRIGTAFSSNAGGYNYQNAQFVLPEIEAIFTCSGMPLQFQGAFVILNGRSVAGRYITFLDPNEATLTIPNHGLINGDRLILTPSSNSTIPLGISSTDRYYVNVIDADTFELHLSETLTQKINFYNTGSGSIYARYASGRIAMVVGEPEPINLLDQQSYSYRFSLRESAR